MSMGVDMDILERANSGMAGVSVNPLEYPSVKCDKCGCETFVPAYTFKKIPGLVMGRAGEDVLMPITVSICSKCGELMPEYKDKGTETKENKENNNLIL